jgi:hypothetical protein
MSDRSASDEKTLYRLGPVLDHPDFDRALRSIETPARKPFV